MNLYHHKRTLFAPFSQWIPIIPMVPSKTPASTLPTKLRVATWNIWFDAMLKSHRDRYLLHLLQLEDPDVICLQEVTQSFEEALRANTFARDNWAISSLEDQQQATKSHYGTVIIVHKRLGTNIKAVMSLFPGSNTGRSLLYVELKTPTKTVRVGTVHLDYTPEQRRAEFEQCIAELTAPGVESSAPVAAILCGDTNVDTYDEIRFMVDAGFVDSLLATHVPPPDEDLYCFGPTFGTTMTRPGGKRGEKEYRHRRLDYVLAKNATQVNSYKLLGQEQMEGEWLKGSGAEEFKEYQFFASDHAGILVDLELEE